MVYGLVGRSGSGKSTASEVFREYGIYVVDCDKVAAEVLCFDEVINKLSSAFGDDIVTNNTVDKKLLAKRAFENETTLKKLNSITHPVILDELKKKIEGKTISVLDAPTLFESGAYKMCDKIIAVIADDDLCKKRLFLRDGTEEDMINRRLAMQKDNEFLKAHADILLVNSGTEEEFIKLARDTANLLI